MTRLKLLKLPGGTGRLPSRPDPQGLRSSTFSVRRLYEEGTISAPPEQAFKPSVLLRLVWWGDQGMTPRCVGFSGEAWQRTTPSLRGRKGITLDHAGYYLGAQQYDGWPGEGYDGSSIEGLLAFMVAHPDVDVQSYRWAHQLYDLLVWFNQREHPTTAPLLGIDWHSGMWWPDSSGIIKPTGMVDGGHALICRGYRFDRGWRYSLNGWTSHLWFQLHNSWSREWGDNGRAWIRGDHLQDLMDAQGECGLATKWERAA